MKIDFTKTESGSDLVRFEGDFDYHHTAEARDKLNAFLENKPAKILVDLAGVPYIDSSGIAVFVELSQKCRVYGGRLIFFNLTGPVRSVFEMAKLHLFFSIVKSQEEAERFTAS